MKPCKRCKHPFSEHASDVDYPDALRCFHGAFTGDGCAEKYADRCPNYVNPDFLEIT
jgi:hypothetical protein